MKLNKAKVEYIDKCKYRITHVGISEDGNSEKRRGFIIETPGEALIIPFKKTDKSKRRQHKIRETDNGNIRLSAARQKVTISITLDREQDSEEAFLDEFHKLTDGYVLDLLKYEIESCLE